MLMPIKRLSVLTHLSSMKVLTLISVFLLVNFAYAARIDKDLVKPELSFPTGYVINGQDAEPHSAPYIVSLSLSSAVHSHNCGGTIIDKEWILTAAHCMLRCVGISVIAGLHERFQVDNATQKRLSDFCFVHNEYTGGVGPYDIALIHLSEPFEFNEYVQPAALPQQEEIHSGTTHLYGWGKQRAFSVSAAQTLQTVETEITEWSKCKEILPDDAPLHPTNICSDSLDQGISACSGDSGGPLVIENRPDPTVEIIGVVSWGYIPCGLQNFPSVYTRVSAYKDWILKSMAAYHILH